MKSDCAPDIEFALANSEDDKKLLDFNFNLDNSYKKVLLFSNKNSLISFIEEIINDYKNTKTSELVDILHWENSAWYHVWNNGKGEGNKISDDLIKKYDY